MATHLGRTPLCANTFLVGCDSMMMLNISAAQIDLRPWRLAQQGNNSLEYAAMC
jgi:hypothetical protein